MQLAPLEETDLPCLRQRERAVGRRTAARVTEWVLRPGTPYVLCVGSLSSEGATPSVLLFCNRKNDPAAGSPTATLLRLLLPLLKKYR